MPTSLRVTFDTNTYGSIARPQLSKIITAGWPPTKPRILSKGRRLAWWYIQWCIRKCRIHAGIPEGAFTAEVLPNVDRVDLLLVAGTNRARPVMTAGRRQLIQKALELGFRVMHGPRIQYGELFGFDKHHWAADDIHPASLRQQRMSSFIRHFNEYPKKALRSFGVQLAATHHLPATRWREGLAAEGASPKLHSSGVEFQKALRKLMSDWADFDITATHYAYGYDFLCTEDTGKPTSDSIFGPTHTSDVRGKFGVRTISAVELAQICWKRYRLPLWTWQD